MVEKIKVTEIKELMSFADDDKNAADGIDINSLFVNSSKVLNWKCDNGHTFREKVSVMYRRKHKCFYCTGRQIWSGENDLQTLYPELAKEWHPTKNKKLTPAYVTAQSGHKVWWLGKCGHA